MIARLSVLDVAQLCSIPTVIKSLLSKLPYQWWVKEGHWCKTTWRYVLTGRYPFKSFIAGNIRLGRP